MEQNKITIEREETRLNLDFDIPEECKVKIFIPAHVADSNQCCYLVDIKNKKITSWYIDLSQANTVIRKMIQGDKTKDLPLSLELENFIRVIHAAHSAKYYKGKIYVFTNSHYMVCLDPENSKNDEVICSGYETVYSGTNDIHEDKIFFARWNIYDAMSRQEVGKQINVDVGTYDINSKEFNTLTTFEGPDNIHQVALTPDKRNVVLIEMGRILRNKKYPEYTTNKELLLEILKDGAAESQIVKYNFKDKTVKKKFIDAVPGHLEIDPEHPDTGIVSCHNLVGNYSYGNGRLLKIKFDDLSIIESYEHRDLIRIPSHTIFKHKGKKLIVTNGYPKRIFIIHADDMSLGKCIYLGKKITYADFSNGPYNVEAYGRTPFTMLPVDNTPFLYLVDPYQIRFYDFEGEKTIGAINYNFNFKSLTSTGHASIFKI